MSTAVQLVVIGLVLVSIGLIVRLVRHRRLQGKYVLLWLSACVLMLPVALFPDQVDELMRDLGVAYPPAAYLLVATVVLFGVTVHQSVELSRLDDRTRALAEEVALLRSDLEPPRGTDGPT